MSNSDQIVQVPLPTDLIRIRAWKQFVTYNILILQDFFTEHIAPLNATLEFNDWIHYVFEHTSNDALRRYYTVHPNQ